MNRREAISAVAWLLGGTVVGADLLVSCTSKPVQVNSLFNADQVALLNEVAETILPATSTPGAKEAKVGDFMAQMVLDCYKKEDQEVFTAGINKLDQASKAKYGDTFMYLDKAKKTALLTALDQEQKEYQSSKKSEDPNHYFRMMKELTLVGYFTSEVGATQALRYDPVPGKYDGCMPYKKGDKAWAT
ncbi:gluconate 2-dehydrogenase subunit 3 family protein [Pontibacter sp. SGAir0037]|uniref:gluconate 2-dehydrogenase subunit 3 family protein n=1 Tax=Pontibacter sp. SGAir0037 TaxID=2571030 RepID=UPI0010CCB20D|nr:gluconate 2-dehydrogenase subunit 3 family protein [Pontibacter sp. SGAir0037]QCR22029.1 twin-arginine translocation pathway signal protein [Pontibacter sp. SGAir0037]